MCQPYVQKLPQRTSRLKANCLWDRVFLVLCSPCLRTLWLIASGMLTRLGEISWVHFRSETYMVLTIIVVFDRLSRLLADLIVRIRISGSWLEQWDLQIY